MEELSKIFEQRLQKIDMFFDFCTLAAKKSENRTELLNMQSKNQDVQQIVIQATNLLTKFRNIYVDQIRELMKKSQQQTIIMLNIMNEFDKSDQHKSALLTPNIISYGASKYNSDFLRTPNQTLILSIDEYGQSPFVSRMKPMSLKFLDFEATIDNQQFLSIPQYIRGRDTLDDLLDTLELIKKCFTLKYTLFFKKREAITNPRVLELWKCHHIQENYFPGKKFITQGDISFELGRSIDKKTISRIAMLRHLQILKEARNEKTICYIWNS